MMKKKKAGRIALCVALALAAAVAACAAYISDYYRADASVRACLSGGGSVTASQTATGLFLDGPGTDAALIFYPGAKVEYTAYAPLLSAFAADGVDCFLEKMPGNLAIFGKGRAEKVMRTWDYDRWYLAGHSLGGAMAADWAAAHPEALAGLVLLAAYPTKPLPEGLAVLELYGSEDGVLDREKRDAGDAYLPEGAVVQVLEGGNHAQFGDYGPQKGDGAAAVSRQEQQSWTAAQIEAWLSDGRD